MPFYLYSSNRLENLATALADLCKSRPLPPMLPETIVVQSGGMARWLNFRFAHHLGVSANLDCPFPNGFLERIFQQFNPGTAGEVRLSQPYLHWLLMKILPGLLDRPAFAVLDRYLADGGDLKRFQLSGRLADLFDQYLIFRPDLIAAWERGQDDSWQARLWRELLRQAGAGKPVLHRAQLRDRLLETLASGELPATALPSRFSVFGLSSLPPFYLQVFDALANQVEVHFFLLNPCRQYWGDILPAKSIDRLGGAGRAEELHLNSGNRLLATLGQQGRELFGQLLDCRLSREEELFVEPVAAAAGPFTMLARLQEDILDLHEGLPGETAPAGDDRSIQVHICHSPMRELEVLHDRLLALFEADRNLEPRDVLVMTPDIESYSSLIQAVFGSRNHGVGAVIPFRIADRFISNEGELVGSFLALLKMVGSRLEISRVLALLEMAPVRARFGLTPDEVELCAGWLTEVNVRWGIDEQDRRELGLPATRENTWKFGMERLLLGYAMRGKSGEGFAAILPYDNLEGGETAVLGRFLDFAERLFAAVRELPGSRTLRQWSEVLLRLADGMLAVENYQDNEWRSLAGILQGLAYGEDEAGFAAPVTFEVAFSALERACRAERLTAGFLAGGVTFCELLPMRAVPFKVICLLGLNDGAFPRPEPTPSFNLIAAQPRPGDRSRRKDDRYLFLEVLLSARQHLHLSYVGRSVRDGSELPPSVLVSELTEYLQSRFPEAADAVEIAHPLQPFSPEYFAGNPALVSYSRADYQGARALAAPGPASALAAAPLHDPPAELRSLDLRELVDCFKHPARFFCRRRLGIILDRGDAKRPDSENFSLEPLARYQLGGAMLTDLVEQSGRGADFFNQARRQGILPHGSVGSACFEELQAEAGRQAETIRARGGGLEKHLLAGELVLGGFTLSGQVTVRENSGQFRSRFAKLKAQDLIETWLSHLFLNCLEPAEALRITTLISRDRAVIFQPVADCRARLATLLDFYWQGLRQPLPFFPATSREYYDRLRKGVTVDAALDQARSIWEGDEFRAGEGDDPYHQLCYRGLDPLSAEFSLVSLEFWGPLLENCHGK
jgi:exodeoxyribonuclease V gamma subunit